MDLTIRPLLERTLDVSPENQLVFDLGMTMQENYNINSEVFKNWHNPFSAFLRTQKTIQLIHKCLVDDPSQGLLDLPPQIRGSIFRGKEAGLPKQIWTVMDLSDDDILLAQTTYECRINRKKMPYNGFLRILSDYISFFADSFVGVINLAIPYGVISNIKSSKNL